MNVSFSICTKAKERIKEIANNKEIANVTITNILGKVVKTTTMNGENTQLSVKELINGVYFVSIETTNKVITKSLVKR